MPLLLENASEIKLYKSCLQCTIQILDQKVFNIFSWQETSQESRKPQVFERGQWNPAKVFCLPGGSLIHDFSKKSGYLDVAQ